MPQRPERPRRDVNRLSSLRTRVISLVLLAFLPGLVLLLSTGHVIDTRLTVLTLVALVFIAIGGAYADLFIVRRVRALVAATRRVAAGDLAPRIGPPYSGGELGQLGRAFDEMAEVLHERYAETERAKSELQASLVVLQASDEELKRLLAHGSVVHAQAAFSNTNHPRRCGRGENVARKAHAAAVHLVAPGANGRRDGRSLLGSELNVRVPVGEA